MTSAILPRIEAYGRRAVGFALRHRWSLPLSFGSAVSFTYLGQEMRDGDLDSFDALAAGAVHDLRGTMDGLMLALTQLGGGSGMAAVCVAVVLVLLAVGRRRTALFMGFAGVGTLLLNTGLKLLFHRARPDLA